MYARSTTIRGNPQAMEDGIGYVRDKVLPAVEQMDGCVGLSMFADRESGRCIVTSAWADADALRRSREGVMEMRRRAAEILGGGAEVQEWEIAILHRQYETRDGACTRVVWTKGDPAQLDRMIEAFRETMIPHMEELPGFCSVSVMVDRESGCHATAITYENHTAMESGMEQAVAMRKEFSRDMGIQLMDAASFDLVLAHLRVPETV
jgi:quinol monooxygenase YgiN